MTAVEELVQTLLYEGYALYPYTPGATKNATPTPFGIVYPPAYAAGNPHTFDHLRMVGVVQGPRTARLQVQIRYLEPSGERHEAAARTVLLPPTALERLDGATVEVPFTGDAARGRARMDAQALGMDLFRVGITVENLTDVPEGLGRGDALRHSLLSTHVLARIGGGARFLSLIDPPEHAAGALMTCVSVNTFPVLASDDDDALLGAAIMLPDHPQLAPESRGDLFDGTEIEEALLLHVLALSDDERDQLAEQDPTVRAMVARAVAATPEDIKRLHGRVTVRDPSPDGFGAGARASAGGEGREVKGETTLLVDGTTYALGATVRLRAGDDHAAHDHLLDGRAATIERIYVDYEDNVHLCVTVDDDPGQELMRDIGRYLYFKPSEVELVDCSPGGSERRATGGTTA